MSRWRRFVSILVGVTTYEVVLNTLGFATTLIILAILWAILLTVGAIRSVRQRRAYERALQAWRQQTGLDSGRGFRLSPPA